MINYGSHWTDKYSITIEVTSFANPFYKVLLSVMIVFLYIRAKGLYAIKRGRKESKVMQEMDDGVLLVAVTKV